MKTVIDTTAHPGGGTMRYFQSVLRRFVDDGHEYVVLVPRRRAGPLEIRDLAAGADNVTVREVGVGPDGLLRRFLFQQLVLPVLLYRLDADALFSPGDVTALLSPCPVLLLVHNPNPYYDAYADFDRRNRVKFALLRWLTRLSAAKATKVLFVSEASRDAVLDTIPLSRAKTDVVYHGVEETFFAEGATRADGAGPPHPAAESSDRYLLTVSTVQPHKNYETLLSAFDRLPEDVADGLGLLIAGRRPNDAYFRKLRHQVETMDGGEDVHFLGAVPDETLERLYAGATVYVLPSELETFGMTLLEAMASGAPVVAAETTSLPEVGGDAAAYFDADDPDDLVRVLSDLLRDEDRRTRLGNRGRERAGEFTWDRAATQTKAALEAVASGGV